MQDVLDIEVTPLSSACGAEIKGVDLTKPLSEGTVEAIKDAWGKHLVLVFRGQKVSQDDQLRFASYFGDLGSRKKAPEKLRSRAEGIQQDHEKGPARHQHQGRRQSDRRVRRRRILVPHRFRLFVATLQVHVPLCARTAVHRRQHDVLQHVQGLRGGAGRAQGEAQGQEGAAHPRIQPRQAGGPFRRHQRDPAPLPPGFHHASRHRPQDAVRRSADDDAHRGRERQRRAMRSSSSSTTSASGANSSSSTSGSSAIS